MYTRKFLNSLVNKMPENVSQHIYEFCRVIYRKVDMLARLGSSVAEFDIIQMTDKAISLGNVADYLCGDEENELLKYGLLNKLRQDYPDSVITIRGEEITIRWGGDCGGCISVSGCDCIDGRD